MTVLGAPTTVGETFASLNPATGEPVSTYPVTGAAEVREVVRQAREAAAAWAEVGFGERRRVLATWRTALVRRRAELVDLVHAENGKPRGDAMIEVILAAQHIDWAARHASKVLGRRRVASGLMLLNQSATVEYQPLGVIGVLGPWDYPVFGPVGTVAYAIAGGNAAVLKHSELTPAIGEWLAELRRDEHPVTRLTGRRHCRGDHRR